MTHTTSFASCSSRHRCHCRRSQTKLTACDTSREPREAAGRCRRSLALPRSHSALATSVACALASHRRSLLCSPGKADSTRGARPPAVHHGAPGDAAAGGEDERGSMDLSPRGCLALLGTRAQGARRQPVRRLGLTCARFRPCNPSQPLLWGCSGLQRWRELSKALVWS